MTLIDLAPYSEEKNQKSYLQLQKLVNAIKSENLDDAVVQLLNEQMTLINAAINEGQVRSRRLRSSYQKLVSILEKQVKMVPPNHYQSQWMVLGMSLFGVPMGVAFSMSLENYSFMGLGLPIGMGIGIALGRYMDQKAAKEGRQLKF